ncbi:MAG: hypothetical protein IPK10_16195 [Bacteroidetes bacterium]|nr:hypothetical protein [Bacteroidota bacterium]
MKVQIVAGNIIASTRRTNPPKKYSTAYRLLGAAIYQLTNLPIPQLTYLLHL